MKLYKFWTFKQTSVSPGDEPSADVTLYGVMQPDPVKRISGCGDTWELVASGPATFHNQGMAEGIARELAKITGQEWDFDLAGTSCPDSTNYGYYYITRQSDGLQIQFSEDTVFQYSRPRGPRGEHITIYENHASVPSPSAMVSATKNSMEQMARSIVRRLLPDAESLHKKILEQIERLKESANATAISLEAVCAALGETTDKPTATFKFHGYQRFKVNEGGSVDFELQSLPTHAAVKLARWLNENR